MARNDDHHALDLRRAGGKVGCFMCVKFVGAKLDLTRLVHMDCSVAGVINVRLKPYSTEISIHINQPEAYKLFLG